MRERGAPLRGDANRSTSQAEAEGIGEKKVDGPAIDLSLKTEENRSQTPENGLPQKKRHSHSKIRKTPSPLKGAPKGKGKERNAT